MTKFARYFAVALLLLIFNGCALPAHHPVGHSSGSRVYAVRLKPDQDLRREIERFATENRIHAGYILSGVGSLKAAALRFADQTSSSTYVGKFEIVSLTGTIATNGVHLHISIADKEGRTIGGHLVEGCKIYTTAEIVIGTMRDVKFSRELDPQTGYKELKIMRKTGSH